MASAWMQAVLASARFPRVDDFFLADLGRLINVSEAVKVQKLLNMGPLEA